MSKNQQFLYVSRFSRQEVEKLESRCGIEPLHLLRFVEAVLCEATVHDYIIYASQMAQEYGIEVGP